MTDVDVIILDIDGGDMLRACVDSVRAQTVRPREIIVFDNGSRVPSTAHSARILRSESNLGFATAVNAAYRSTLAAYVALINNDVVVDADWLAAVKKVLDDDETVAAAQTILRRDDATIDGAGIDVDGRIRQIGHGQPIRSHVAPAWGVSATAALYRRSALGERVFDPRFFAYYEDVELSARLHDQGWKTVVIPEVKATHRGSMSAPVLGAEAVRLRTRNRYLVARMHRGVGRIRSLLAEDLILLVRGKSSVRGIVEGLCTRL